MVLDKPTINKLKKYSQVFKDARERNINESDTVMYLVKFFEDVLGYDSLAGDISKEVSIKDRYCDFGIKIRNEFKFLVEVKASGNKALRTKDIEQAENYGSRMGIKWVLLTNGLEWQLYHLSFNEGDGIMHDMVFCVNLLENDNATFWNSIGLITKESIENDLLEDFLNHKKALSPQSLLNALFSEDVLTVLRRELNRSGEVRLDILDIVNAIKDVLSKEAIMVAGDIGFKKRRKRKKRTKREDNNKEQDNNNEQDESDGQVNTEKITKIENDGKKTE